MRLHVYTFAWNEARMVPFFLRHYLPIAERIVVFDNGSTDGTAELLARHSPRVEVRRFETTDYPEPEPMGSMRSTCWHEARGQADWVALVDFDEFLWHPGGALSYLARAYAEGYSLVRTYGWEMVAKEFPPEHVDLVKWCRTGVAWSWYSKPVVFRPEQIDSAKWVMGCHQVKISGMVRYLRSAALSLLHYKHLGLDYVTRRHAEYRDHRLDDTPKENVYRHYRLTPEEEQARFTKLLQDAADITL